MIKNRNIIKRAAICFCISTLLISNITGCGKKKESGKKEEILAESGKVDKDCIFKEEDFDGVFDKDVDVPFMELVGDKFKCVSHNYSENKYKSLLAGKDGSVEGTFDIPIEDEAVSAHFAADDAGNLYVQYDAYANEDAVYEEDAKPIGSWLIKYDATGKELNRINLFEQFADVENYKVEDITWTKKYGLVLSTARGIETYSEDGSFNVSVDAGPIDKLELYEVDLSSGKDDQIYISGFGQSGTELYKVDLENKKLGEKSKCLGDLDWAEFFKGEGYDLYVKDQNNIYGYDSASDSVTKLLNISDSDIGVGYGIRSCVALSATEMYAVTDGYNESYVLAKLTKVNPEDVKDKTVITMGTMSGSGAVAGTVARFNRKNEKYRIKVIDFFDTYNSSGEYEDMLNEINLDILSGKGPDIICFDNSELDLDSYINKGVLLDLTSVFEQGGALGDTELLPNVFEMMKTNGKIYTVFPSFDLNTYMLRSNFTEGKTTLTYEDCDEIIKNAGTDYKDAFYGSTKMGMLYDGVVYGGKKYIDKENKKCDFKNSEFIDLLNFANKFPENFEDGMNGYDPFEPYAEGKSIFLDNFVSDFWWYANVTQGVLNGDVVCIGFPNNSGENLATISPNMQMGINSKSKNVDGAIEFIKGAFDVTYDKSYDYFPSVKAAFEEQMKYATEEDDKLVFYNDTKGRPLTEEEVQKLYEYVLSINTLRDYDWNIGDILEEESAAFFSGQKSAEEVADIIQSRVTTYINENS